MDGVIGALNGLQSTVKDMAFAEVLRAALGLGIYVVLGNLILRPSYSLRSKAALFAVLNLVVVYGFFFRNSLDFPPSYEREAFIRFAFYVAFASAHWFLIAALRRSKSAWLYWAAIAYPIVPLIAVKIETAWQLIGFSYMAFRMAQAALEVRRKPEMDVSLSAYVALLFFPLTIPIGPISPFGFFSRGLGNGVAPSFVSIGRGLARILLGYVMLRLLATIAFQFSFGGMWNDGLKHGIGDLLIASFGSFAYLYFNFAGFTHIVIGAAALLGIPVKENFDSPILSRSIKEFWNRWHITLSEFMRDLIYTPLAVTLTRSLGVRLALLAAVLAGMVTFVALGLWHQFSLGFLLFGVMHGLGFGVNAVFDDLWGKRMPKSGPSALAWNGASWLMTMTWIALSMIVIEFSTLSQVQAALGAFEPRW